MTTPNKRHEHKLFRNEGFTLIELLVVVAIIALLISILLPSLSKARAQARTTVCASRIGQLAKAMLLYADDFNETPPFMGLGWEDIPTFGGSTANAPYDIPRMTKQQWAIAEDWVSPKFDLMWNKTEQDWPTTGCGVRFGSLYPYSRFENLYRCPEFERIQTKSQNQFNYTRTILGRKWVFGGQIGAGANGGVNESDYWGSSDFGAPGYIMKVGGIYSPGTLNFLIDEMWNRHVAADPTEQVPFGKSGAVEGGWSANDCMYYALQDEIGQYHGSDVTGRYSMDTSKVKRGNSAFYDGHVSLERDPLPGRVDMNLGSVLFQYKDDVVDWLNGYVYAQRAGC